MNYKPARSKTPSNWEQWAAPSLISLLRRSAELTPKDEIGSLNGDPICGCQEWSIKSVAIVVQDGANGEAIGTASFVNYGQSSTIRFRLTPTAKGWQIADIMTADMPSLRQYLQTDIAQRTATSVPQPAGRRPQPR